MDDLRPPSAPDDVIKELVDFLASDQSYSTGLLAADGTTSASFIDTREDNGQDDDDNLELTATLLNFITKRKTTLPALSNDGDDTTDEVVANNVPNFTSRQLLLIMSSSSLDFERFLVAVQGTGEENHISPLGNEESALAEQLGVDPCSLPNFSNKWRAVWTLLRALRGISLLEQAGRPDKPELLNEVIDAFTDVVECSSEDARFAPLLLPFNLRLAVVLGLRFERLENIGDLHRAISSAQHIINSEPSSDSNNLDLFVTFGELFVSRYDLLEDLEDLEQAIALNRRVVDLALDDDPRKPIVLDALGSVLLTRFEHLEELHDLEQAIAVQRCAIDLISDDHPDKSGWLNNLGITLQTRFECVGELRDLEQAITVTRRAVELTSDDNPDKLRWLNNLGAALQTRFERLGELEDLEQSIVVHHRSVELILDDHPDKSSMLNNLGIALQLRFDRLSNLKDLEQAIEVYHRATELAPNDHPDKPGWLGDLGNVLQTRFEHLGELEDLDRAIMAHHRAVKLALDDHPDKSSWLNNLGVTLQTRFERLGELKDLEQAITLTHLAVDLVPDDHPNKSKWLNNLGAALQMRFGRLGDLKDLEYAIVVHHRTVKLTLDDHPDKASMLNNLGAALQTHFDRLGELRDLEQAIEAHRHAVRLTPDDRSPKLSRLNDLAIALRTRFERLGELEDLEQAITVYYRIVELTPNDHASKPTRLNNLGNALRTSFDRFGELKVLEKAVEVHRRAVELTPNDHPDKSGRLNNLGSALQMRFKHLGELEDLEEAIMVMFSSIELAPDDHLDKSIWLYNLGNALFTRSIRNREKPDLQDLEQAASSLRQCDTLTPFDHPYKTPRLALLAGVDYLHSLASGKQDAWVNTRERLRIALASESSSPLHRLYSAHFLALLQASHLRFRLSAEYATNEELSHQLDQVVDVYKHIFTLIPQVAWLGVSITRRFEVLSRIGELTSRAVAIAIAFGELSLAIEWLEQGRSVVWGQLLQLRNPVDQLREQHPELARHLQTTSRELERSANTTGEIRDKEMHGLSGATGSGDHTRDNVAVRVELAQEYQTLLSQIHALSGFEHFMIPRKFNDITQAWDGNPVVLINVSPDVGGFSSLGRCDALAYISPGHIIHVPLPGVEPSVITKMASKFIELLNGSRRRERADLLSRETEFSPEYAPSSLADDERAEQRASQPATENASPLKRALSILWKKIMWPILQAIESKLPANEDGALPHVTWCTTGSLTFLPIHAAGDYDSPGGKKIFDYVVSSYTPTLSSLLPGLTRSQTDPSLSPQILIISQPATPGLNPLPETANEVARVKSHFQPHETIHLDGDEATVATVLHAIEEHKCSYIHMACHGMQDPTDPMKSAFALYDARLDLATLMSKTSDNAKLAFLSACQTATGDAKLTDEAVHLAAAMLAMGYRGVIGTLWSIVDEDAPLVTDVFYRVLKEREAKALESEGASGSQVHAAYALHEATKALREKVGESDILRWAPFVHFGR